jgi:transposase
LGRFLCSKKDKRIAGGSFRLIMALKKISSRHKQALLLRMQGLNYEQIAEQLGVGVSTVENWFYRDATFRDAFEQFKQQYIDEITKTARERMQSAADQAM